MTDIETAMLKLHTVAPDWLVPEDDDPQIEGEYVLGWRLMTEVTLGTATPVGYQIVTDGGIYEANMDGVIYRSTHLNMV
jgi:hypothetical protein